MDLSPQQKLSTRSDEWFAKGWELVSSDWRLFVFAAFVTSMGSGLSAGILAGPLMVGMYLMIFEKIDTGRSHLGTLAAGFRVLGQAVLAWLVPKVIILGISAVLGPLAVIAAALVSAAYLFTYPLVADRGVDFWTAMEASRRKVMKCWLGVAVFSVAVHILWGLGALAFGVGVFLTMPVAMATIAFASRDLFPKDGLSA
jgi:uncharacterized membrane protein